MAPRLLGLLGLVLALLLTACTYSPQEPGLFRPRTPAPAPLPSEDPTTTPAVNPSLPVAGESLWTSGEGSGLTTRFAVHAVRRIPGATVLDYSVTPLSPPGLQPGDPPPGRIDFGLVRDQGNGVAVWLMDPARSRVYRSLAHVSQQEFNHCLCTPLWTSQPTSRLRHTQLLQVTFPPLPRGLQRVDVLLANQAPVVDVPVTPIGQVPTAGPGTRADLTRPAEPRPTGALRSVAVPALGRAARVEVGLDEVLAAPGLTALRWTIRAPTGLDYRLFVLGPPVARPLPDAVPVPALNSTDGPSLRAPGARGPLRGSWMTARLNGRPGYECLCSELDLWARSLLSPGGTVRVTTVYPGLPAGTRRVRVDVPGLAPVHLAVIPLPSAAGRLGPPATEAAGTWDYLDDAPPPPREVDEWPTPVPDEWQLPDYRGSVERVRALPAG